MDKALNFWKKEFAESYGLKTKSLLNQLADMIGEICANDDSSEIETLVEVIMVANTIKHVCENGAAVFTRLGYGRVMGEENG